MDNKELFKIKRLRNKPEKIEKSGKIPGDWFIEDDQGNRVASLLGKVNIMEGFDIIPHFTPTKDFIFEAGSLMPAFFIVKNEIEKITGQKIEY
jgi:hypothetical protein